MKKAVVIGAGKSGKGAASLLESQGYEVILTDKKEGFIHDDPSLPLEGVSLLILSPGVLPSHPLAAKALRMGILVMGEVELGLLSLRNQRMVAVTGSNGKTTTVLLITHVLNKAGLRACALGNVGVSLCSYAAKANPDEILVIELSSFQLQMLPIAPYFEVAAILNITPNHLDRHSSMQEYAECKLKLQMCTKEGGVCFVSKQVRDNFSFLKEVQIFKMAKEERQDPKLGLPEACNIQSAREIAMHFGIEEEMFSQALLQFRKPPHRIEWVAEIDQVAYYNDSKASNVEAVIHAVSLFTGLIVLIAGGVDKGAPYKPWIDAFGKKVKAIVAFGMAKEKMVSELQEAFPIQCANCLQEAAQKARRFASAGDTILFSPGCSSYDQFASYEERGETFRKIIQEGV